MEPKRGLKGWLLVGTAFLFCPCHLVFILPFLAGTAFGGILSQYYGVAIGVSGAIFVILVWIGLKSVNPDKEN